MLDASPVNLVVACEGNGWQCGSPGAGSIHAGSEVLQVGVDGPADTRRALRSTGKTAQRRGGVLTSPGWHSKKRARQSTAL